MSSGAAAAAERTGTERGGEPPDHQLVAMVRRGDDRSFERLYERYHRRIAAYVYGMVCDYGRAEDITQEVFISALRRMRETERPIAFKPWVYEIAKNACIDQFRRSRRAEEVSFDADEGLGAADYGRLVSTDAAPDAAMDAKQQLDHLCGAFGGLSESHHQILVLRELEGLSYREIGEKMGLSRPSVESTLFRARRRLTEEYDELVSGERCRRIHDLMASTGNGHLGNRDHRRVTRHLSHCQPCRRHARVMGVDCKLNPRESLGTSVAQRVAGFLPFPLPFVFRGRNAETAAGVTGGGRSSVIAHWSTSLGTMSETLAAGWAKSAMAVATVAIATMGAAATSNNRDPVDVVPDRGSERQTAKGAERAAARSGEATRRARGADRAHTRLATTRTRRPGTVSRGSGSVSREAGAAPTGGSVDGIGGAGSHAVPVHQQVDAVAIAPPEVTRPVAQRPVPDTQAVTSVPALPATPAGAQTPVGVVSAPADAPTPAGVAPRPADVVEALVGTGAGG